jgi:predicted TIM-barrel fold metal-dependent hydrolase
MVGDQRFRPMEARLWDPQLRLAWLDAAGIDAQLVCATPIMFGYAWPAAAAATWCARMNDLATGFCAADPRRLQALAQVPLQDIDAACREVTRARRPRIVLVLGSFWRGDRNPRALLAVRQHNTGLPFRQRPPPGLDFAHQEEEP